MAAGCTNLGKIKKDGKTLTGFETIYVNDSLKISSTFNGNAVSVKKRKQLRTFLKTDGLRAQSKFCLAFYKTDFPDTNLHDRHYYIFYFPNEKKGMKQLSIPPSFIEQFWLDSLKNEVIKFVYPDKDGIVAFIGINPDTNFPRLKSEYLDYFFPRIKTGVNYTQHPTQEENDNKAHEYPLAK
jgi:hypothetical protein